MKTKQNLFYEVGGKTVWKLKNNSETGQKLETEKSFSTYFN